MADPIQLRDVIQAKPAQTAQAPDTQIKGIDIGEITKPLQGAVNERQREIKSRLDTAWKTREQSYRLSLKKAALEAKARVTNSEGLTALEVAEKERVSLLQSFDQASSELPENMSEEQSNIFKQIDAEELYAFDSVAIPHKYKESEAFADGQAKSLAELTSQEAVLYATNPEQFEKKLLELDDVNQSYGFRKGFGNDKIELLKSTSKSLVSLRAVEQLANTSYPSAKEFFEKNQERMNPVDKNKAVNALKTAQDRYSLDIAANIVDQAFSLYPENFEGARKFIEQQTAGDGKARRSAIDMFSNQYSFKQKEKTRREEEQMNAVTATLFTNGGRLTPSILRSIPPGKEDEVRLQAKRIATGEYNQPNPALFGELYKQALDPKMRQEFSTKPLGQFRAQLSDEEYTTLTKLQQTMGKEAQSLPKRAALSANKIMDNVLKGRGLDPTIQADEYYTRQQLGQSLMNELVEKMPNADVYTLEKEFEKQFRLQTIPKENSGWWMFRKESPLFLKEVEERTAAGENVLDVDAADPALVERIRKALGDKATDSQVQETLNTLMKQKYGIK